MLKVRHSNYYQRKVAKYPLSAEGTPTRSTPTQAPGLHPLLLPADGRGRRHGHHHPLGRQPQAQEIRARQMKTGLGL